MGCVANTAIAATEQEDAACREPVSPCREPVSPRSARPNFHRRYLLEEKIGEGCFACVYSCRRTDDGPECEFAVKITDLRRLKADQPAASDCYSRAQQEAALLKSIGSREHCCRFVDSMVDRRFHYLVMEKYSTTLYHALERMPELTERTLAAVVQQMFIAVSEVHALGILHRDVKPDNFLCAGPDATVKLCDFGFARKFPSGPACVRGVFGTAPFMSPEMIMGLEYAAPTDVWSLGVILYVLLCGEFPYMPEKPCKQLMRVAIARGTPRPSFAPRAEIQGVRLSTGAVEFLQALLNRDPEMRPSATEALEYGWFRAPAEGEEPATEPPSLRDALFAAECVGAFGSSSGGAGGQTVRSADRMLQELQRKYRWQDTRSNSGGLQDDTSCELSHSLDRSPKSPRTPRSPKSPATGERTPRSPKSPASKMQQVARAPQLYDAQRLGVLINT
jgi:serine/threonine protein kinase